MKNKTAVVTGGSKGLGKELVLILLENGYSVATIARSEKLLKDLEKKVEVRSSKKLLAFKGDLTDSKSIVNFCKRVKQQYDSVDLIINNAGFNTKKTDIEDTDLLEISNQFQVHAITPFIIYKEFIGGMKKKNHGHIVNILSDQVRDRARGGWAAYNSTKHALYGLGKVMAAEAAENRIRVTNAIIGGMDTTFREEERPKYLNPKVVAESLMQIIKASEEVYIPEIVLYPQVYLLK